MIYQKIQKIIYYIYQKYIINNTHDLSGNINKNINDLSENAYDVSQNLCELKNTVTDLSGNVEEINQVMIYKS